MKKSHDNTIAAQLLGHIDPHSAGVTPSLQMSTTFVRDAENALVRPDNSYGRDQNDGVRLAEDVIAALEEAEDVLLFPSGMAAIAVIFQALPRGSRVLVQSGIYWGTMKFIGDHAALLRMDVDFIDTSDEDALDQVTSDVQRQMPDGGGYLMSLLVKGGRQAALDVVSKLTLFHRATSLGGVESLVEHRHTIEPHTGIPENLIRISIGVEKVEDLIADFEQALLHHA
ncbi:MAG: hypothetical protein EBW60_03950 [Rhodobacteraceae bacterium]|nr:hypothetical protein [Paracoccaceae bacterium]